MVRAERRYVVVVAGVPRSGTSLMMQMLEAGGVRLLTDGVRRPDPDNPRGYREFEPARRLPRDVAWLAGAAGVAVKVVHVLVPHLPSGGAYRVILMRRCLDEVLASQRALLERRGAGAGSLPDARLAAVFAAQLAEVERWAAGRAGAALLRVDYNRLVADPGSGAAAVDGFLGGGLDTAAMAAAVDPSLYRRRAGRELRPR